MKFGIIGQRLGHSFSKELHGKCGIDYEVVELQPDDVENFVKNCRLDGFNVTIPYKKAVMQYLDELDQSAQQVGAVNTVVVQGGKTRGYNTDYAGLRAMIVNSGVDLSARCVLVLGSGGASATACAVAKTLGAADVCVVSRCGEIDYTNVYAKKANANVIINATPVGMFPAEEGTPIDVKSFPELEAVFDCVYNPIRPNIVLDAMECGIVAKGGLEMLITQGIEAQKIWGVYDKQKAEIAAKCLISQKNNLVLSGMAGAGKTTLGRLVAKALNRPFFDLDEEICRCTGRAPAQIIKTCGEEEFRQVESDVLYDLTRSGGKVISLGGGAVLRAENVRAAKRNGILIYVVRDLDLLDSTGRPLSQKEGVQALFERRRPIYESTCDGRVNNSGDINEVAKEIVRLYEDISYKRS